MDPKLKEQIFIRKHRNSIITVIVMVLILPMLLIFPQTGTQYRQQAAEIVKTPNDSNPPLTTQPNINKAAGETQKDYAEFIKCFDKPNQTNPCSPAERIAADLNNDGIVDGVDYNLFIRKNTDQK